MRFEKPSQEQEIELNMTPMIDVTFLLIIFFMVVSEMVKMEAKEGIILPIASEAKPDDHPERKRLVLNIDKNGDVWAMNILLSPEQLDLLLKREAEISRDDQGLSTRAILIRADRRVEYRHVARLMSECMKHKIWKLSFATKPLK